VKAQAFTRCSTPIGDLTLTASDTALTGVHFSPFEVGADWVQDERHPMLVRTREQLTAYFAGARPTFDLPLDAPGSAFERRVWDALRAIPYGTTTSYGALARRLGDVKSTRAVGAANGKNPIPIIVPCHRVVGSKGELTGFGGGLDRKRWLLEHEGALMKLGGG
jgi:methylated-DNA-[protein]-cysteine S-methyltransferase